MNMFGNLSGAAVSLVVGFCVKYLHSYDAAMYSMAAMYVMAAACWLFVDPEEAVARSRGEPAVVA